MEPDSQMFTMQHARRCNSGERSRLLGFINYVYVCTTDRLRRTQSGGLQGGDPDAGQFQRGGLRATAGPRLTRTPESHSSAR